MDILYLIIGLLLGALVIYVILKNKENPSDKVNLSRITDLEKEKSILADRVNQMILQQKNLEETLSKERDHIIQLSASVAAKQEMVNNYLDKLQNQKSEIEDLQKKFSIEFENLSS